MWLNSAPTAAVNALSCADKQVPAQLLQKISQHFREHPLFKVDFVQESQSLLRSKPRTEQGHIWASAQGYLRYSYTTQPIKEFVFDGKRAYFYDAAAEQVTFFEKFQQSASARLLQLLWQPKWQLPPEAKFIECPKDFPAVHADIAHFCLEIEVHHQKEKNNPTPMQAQLQISPVCWPQTLLLKDELGNLNIYRFSQITPYDRDAHPDFHFKLPPNAQKIQMPTLD
jgi:hypothetical protein